MMKKIFAIVLMLTLVCTSAFAASWLEGLSPQKPYQGNPEVDFNETIGYFMQFPINESTIEPGSLTLTMLFPREDVDVGTGKLVLHSQEDGVVQEVDVETELFCRAMDEEELEALLWGCGTAFEVQFREPLEANRHYWIELPKDAIVAPAFENGITAISGKKAWTFNTETDNVIEDFSYYRMVEGKEEPVALKKDEPIVAGDTAKLTFKLGEDAKGIAVFCDAGTIVTENFYYEEDGEIKIAFPSVGEVKWGVVFVAENDDTIYAWEYTTVVNSPA